MCSNISCLGDPWCSQWSCCDSDPSPAAKKEPKKRRLEDQADQPPQKRFSAPLSPGSMEKVCRGYVPANTSKITSWSVRVFNSWREERNKRSLEQCPENLLREPNAELLNFWLSRFVVEVRREDGKPYPPATINGILSGLYRFSKFCVPTGVVCPNFMDRKEPRFRDLTGAIQVRYRELRTEGVGAMVKHAAVVTPEEETQLWNSKVLGVHSPLALIRAVFFYVGKTFCIRGGEEQRRLKRSQFRRSYEPDCYTYVENGSKNRTGVNVRDDNKVVPVFACPEAQPRCLAFLLDTYFDKFSQQSIEMDLFYLRPKKSPKTNIWYDNIPIGRDKLKSFLEDMCREAGITEKKTNHSLRATGATTLFNAGVPEKLIREVTGHRSNALQTYERPSLEQRQNVSKILVQGMSNKENYPEKSSSKLSSTSTPGVVGSIFSGVSNCTITISPQNFSVNVANSDIDVKSLLQGIDLDSLTSP